MFAQIAPRSWPAGAVHDTVRAVLLDPAFRRSLQRSWLDRLLLWLQDWLRRLDKFLSHLPSTRTLGLVLVALLVVFVVARFVLHTVASREDGALRARGSRTSAADDPWSMARFHAASGRYEDAIHLLYRGVVESVAREGRMRVDPSRTSGDYARELRRRGSPALPAFHAFTRRFDDAVYGHGGCDQRAFEELVALSELFAPRVRVA